MNKKFIVSIKENVLDDSFSLEREFDTFRESKEYFDSLPPISTPLKTFKVHTPENSGWKEEILQTQHINPPLNSLIDELVLSGRFEKHDLKGIVKYIAKSNLAPFHSLYSLILSDLAEHAFDKVIRADVDWKKLVLEVATISLNNIKTTAKVALNQLAHAQTESNSQELENGEELDIRFGHGCTFKVSSDTVSFTQNIILFKEEDVYYTKLVNFTDYTGDVIKELDEFVLNELFLDYPELDSLLPEAISLAKISDVEKTVEHKI